jgi:hypothetical protein
MTKPKCAVAECPQPVRANGYCHRHAENLRKYGDPIPQKDLPLAERLRKIGWTVTESGCWEWNGSRNDGGYGLFFARRLGFDGERAHRVVYGHFVRPLWDDEKLRHRCDNPPCVNPAHLEPGTPADNVQDMVERRRHWRHDRTHCDKGHDLTVPGAIRVVRHGTERMCVECNRERQRRWQAKKKAG